MSLFKERQHSAKKTIELQNRILTLQNQLESALVVSKKQKECSICKDLKSKNEALQVDMTEMQTNMKALKSDLKKSRTEATRAINKIATLEAKLQEPKEEPDV